ncbi:MAG: hypothetical protein M3P41_01230 [Actinomycetota bacterium]|jgi:hypothetical protein|nr:hypothetical protein [Actinomycetota bacterium]
MRPIPKNLCRAAAVAVAAVALVGVAAGWTAVHSHEATGPGVVRLTDRQMDDRRIVRGVGGVGDLEVVHLTLFSSAGRAIGHGVLSCTYLARNERSCSGTYVLPRGMILTAGILRTRLLYAAAIIGGTGLYDNASGALTVTAKGLKPRREILLFRLSG